MENSFGSDLDLDLDLCMNIHLWIDRGDDAAIDRLHGWIFSAPPGDVETHGERIARLIEHFERAWESDDKPCKAAFEYYGLLRVAEEIFEREGWVMAGLDEFRESCGS